LELTNYVLKTILTNKKQKVEECDATGDEQNYQAGNTKLNFELVVLKINYKVGSKFPFRGQGI
jgi:hypothetical protein